MDKNNVQNSKFSIAKKAIKLVEKNMCKKTIQKRELVFVLKIFFHNLI